MPTRAKPCDPGDDLAGCAGLSILVGVGNLGWSERLGLGSVDDDLDKPECLVVVAQSALRLVSGDVIPGDPAFEARAVEVSASFSVRTDGDGVVLGDTAALNQIVVVGTLVVGLTIGERGGPLSNRRPRHRLMP